MLYSGGNRARENPYPFAEVNDAEDWNLDVVVCQPLLCPGLK